MRSDAERIAAYTSKTLPSTVALIVTAQLPGMKSGFAPKASALAAKETAIQAHLNGISFPTIQYPFYINFGRELWALTVRGISGSTLITMATSLLQKYIRYGLSSDELIAIASEIFQLDLAGGD